jgi:AcrR family transcriptional regulator
MEKQTRGFIMSPKNKRVDPRVRRTRQMLRDALIELIDEKGYDAITVQDLANRATLNRATFYLHYRDKEDLFTQSIEEILNDLVTGIKECRLPDEPVIDPEGNIIRPLPDLVYIFEHVAKNERFYKVMMGKQGRQHFLFRLLEVFVEILDERLTEGMENEIQPKVPKEILIHYAASAYLGVIAWWLKNGMPYPPEFMAMQLTRLRLDHLQILKDPSAV